MRAGGARRAGGVAAASAAAPDDGERGPVGVGHDDLIAAHIDRLRDAELDRQPFEEAIAALASRSTPKAVAIAVAEGYVGVAPGPWRTRPAALAAIRARCEERRYQTAKLAAAKGVTPW